MTRRALLLMICALRWGAMCSAALVAVACAGSDVSEGAIRTGRVDTLPDGRIVSVNGDRGVWPVGSEWGVIEELRIGTLESEGPDSFGDIASFAVDAVGRIWVLDGFASELRVFDQDGAHVQTLGGKGSGPGEFAQPVHVDLAPEDEVWVMDPGNARVSVFDTAGDFIRTIAVPGAFIMLPWPGGFDRGGFYYAPVARFEPGFRVDLVRFDRTYTPLDTLLLPTDPVERHEFKIVSEGRVLEDEPVPFQGALSWRLSSSGTIWGLISDQYRLFELGARGDTLRLISKTFRPIPIADKERAEALENLKGFVERGGRIDPSLIPSHKPPVRSFFVAEDHLWVERANAYGVKEVSFDIFNPTGEYMGAVTVPFRLQMYPRPIVRGDTLFGVVRDEFDMQHMVRAQIAKAGAN